jgi:ABC-type Mn2+/Zn2+ transport system ATPase subunit
MLCGAIGCGKSSFLQLLLGEMRLRSGSVHVTVMGGGGVGYVPQTAWTLNASFRENILMGRTFEAEWYERVVRCCALAPDQV